MLKHWPWFLFFFGVAFVSFGVRPLADPDEGRYAQTAREMLVTNDWLIPHLHGEQHLTKPPLTYWLIAGSMRWLGVNEWGARLPLAIAFFLTILCVVELARTWGMGATACVAAGLVFATAVLPFCSGHLLTTDMFLTLWETLGVLALWKVWRGSGLAFIWRWVFWLAFGLAFLTKGPPGWLPLLVVVVFHYAARMHRPQRRIFSIVPFTVFLAVSFSWFVLVIRRDPERVWYFVMNEVVARIFSDEHGRSKPFWYYPVLIVFGLLPWIFLWPALVRRTLVDIKPELAERGAFPSFTKLRATIARYWQLTHEERELNFFAFLWGMITHSAAFVGFKVYHFWHRLRRTEDIKCFSFLWFFVPLAVFTIANSKMVFYLVPIFVPLAVWSGHVLAGWKPALLPPDPGVRRWFWLGAAVWCAGALAFTNFPDSAVAPFHRALARTLCGQGGIRQIYTVETPPHSISFYSGVPMRELTKRELGSKKEKEVLNYLRANHPAQLGPALVALKKSKMDKLGDEGYQVVAEDRDVVVFQVGPAPPPAP